MKRGSLGSASPAAINEVVCPAAAAPVTAASLPDPLGEAREVRGAAEAAVARGDLDAALERFAELRALAPDEPDGYLRAGGLLLRNMGQRDAAEQVLAEGVHRIPDDFALRAEHAYCATLRGDLEAALARYRELMTHYPDDPLGYIGAGGALREARRYTDADILVGAALERFSDDPRLSLVHAWIAHYAGDWPEALRRWHKVAALLPDDPQAVFMVGVVLNRGLNRTAEADALLAGGMERFPDHVDIAAEHARTASAQGDWALALRRWQALVERFPAEPKVVAGRGEAEQQCQIQMIDAAESTPGGQGAAAGGIIVSTSTHTVDTGPQIADPVARELMLRFESLGATCEFGLLQRHFGAEPLGLMRWVAVSPTHLCDALEKRLEGMGLPEETSLQLQQGEYYVRESRYHTTMHTFIFERDQDVSEKKLHALMCRRMQILREKMLAELGTGDKIYVLQSYKAVSDNLIARLYRAICSYGPNTLLFVREVVAGEVAGTVEQKAPGLLIGHIDALVKPGSAWNRISTGCWLSICKNAAALVDCKNAADPVDRAAGERGQTDGRTWRVGMRILWKSDQEIELDNVILDLDSPEARSTRGTNNRFPLLKNKRFIDRLCELLNGLEIRNILEFGLFEGGSAILLESLYRPRKLVSVDIKPHPRDALSTYIKDHHLETVLRPYIGIDQADRPAIVGLIETELDGAVDLVIDDASHVHGLTRASFNIAFPYVRTGGIYVIEDWAWSHWASREKSEEVAMTNIIFELVAACGSNPRVIEELVVDRDFVAVRRGPAPLNKRNFDLGDICRLRGRTLQEI